MNNQTFSRIAGYTREKQSLEEIGSLMKQSRTLAEMGIRLPHGVLLLGEPGVGKTVMAEALIAESGLPCERIEPDAGDDDGDSLRTRLMSCAEEAMKKAPCILFADELDKLLGTASPHGMSYDMDNTRVFLHMVDSLKESNVVVIAVANDSRMLNRAVTRSGRFDRVIRIGLPGSLDRQAILRHYAKGKPIARGVRFEHLAQISAGMSGADLECVMNEAGLHAVSDNRKSISRADIEYAIESKRFLGVEKDSELTDGEQRVVAVHEAGHALTAWVLCPSELASVTIRPVDESQGHVVTAPGTEVPTLAMVEAHIAVLTGGKAAERLMYPADIYLGSGDDLCRAYKTATRLLTEAGVGGMGYIRPTPDNPFEISDASEAKQRMIEKRVSEMLTVAESRAYAVLSANRGTLEALVDKLLKVKSLSREALAAFLSKYDTVNPGGADALPEAEPDGEEAS